MPLLKISFRSNQFGKSIKISFHKKSGWSDLLIIQMKYFSIAAFVFNILVFFFGVFLHSYWGGVFAGCGITHIFRDIQRSFIIIKIKNQSWEKQQN